MINISTALDVLDEQKIYYTTGQARDILGFAANRSVTSSVEYYGLRAFMHTRGLKIPKETMKQLIVIRTIHVETGMDRAFIRDNKLWLQL